MRRAELVTALVLALLSIIFMVKSAELPILWVKGVGPGAGAFPFWLGAGMLLSCVWIIFNWARRTSPPSRSEEPYMDGHAVRLFLIGAGSLTVMIGLIQFVGVYVSVPLYLFYYVRFVGRHSWPLTLSIALLTPVIMFFFFEIALNITLPKGVTEPLFYPLYDIFL